MTPIVCGNTSELPNGNQTGSPGPTSRLREKMYQFYRGNVRLLFGLF
jgi:hypothetical protein